MPEATMLVLDNSEYMRNGDFPPSRWDAQMDASTILFDAKVNAHPQNSVGVMTMAGKGPQVLSNLTEDIGRILKVLHTSKIAGDADLATGINIAQLALKHRQDKTQVQRIIAFVASPIASTEEELVALGKKLKKNNVAVDVVNFGEDAANTSKLEKLLESVNNGGNSNLVTVEAGSRLLSDVILSSPILTDTASGGQGGGSGGEGSGGFEFGVDPSMDPELAMALRMSLEEEQARQRASEGGSGSGGGASSSSGPALPTVNEASSESASTSTAAATGPSTSATAPHAGMPSGGSLITPSADAVAGHGSSAAAMDESEDAMLQQAMALSRGGGGGGGAGAGNDDDVEMGGTESSTAASSTQQQQGQSGQATVAGKDGEDEEMTEEEAIARAIEMSMQGEEEQQGGGSGSRK